jgi:hypothetical protein
MLKGSDFMKSDKRLYAVLSTCLVNQRADSRLNHCVLMHSERALDQ